MGSVEEPTLIVRGGEPAILTETVLGRGERKEGARSSGRRNGGRSLQEHFRSIACSRQSKVNAHGEILLDHTTDSLFVPSLQESAHHLRAR